MPGRLVSEPAYQLRCRVYYEDTDAAGIVYYANYLRYMERARSEWLRSLGFEIAPAGTTGEFLFAVHSVNMRYLRPARLNDQIDVTVEPTRIGGASLDLDQHTYRDNELLVRGQLRLACVDSVTLAPRALPASLHSKLIAWKLP